MLVQVSEFTNEAATAATRLPRRGRVLGITVQKAARKGNSVGVAPTKKPFGTKEKGKITGRTLS